MDTPSNFAHTRPAIAPTETLHVAVIMDGNGRWAQSRGLPRPVGHRRGAEQVKSIVKVLPDLGVSHFTVYAFSTENWKRSTQEVMSLMLLFERFIRREAEALNQDGVRVRFIGDRTRLNQRLQQLMASLEVMTSANRRLNFNIAVNYGGRDELVRAAKSLVRGVQSGSIAVEDVDENVLDERLDLAGQPDPDLIIRTGGQMRVSNFLLWSAAYAEYVFTPTLWPDFSVSELATILSDVSARTRTYGTA